jgi:hypothetical protein
MDNVDINLDNIAVKLYGKLQTRFPDVKIGDELGEVLSKEEDIPKARFFEFPYKIKGVLKGTITIKLDDKKGLVLQVGGDLVDSDVPGIFEFIRSMGAFANKKMMNFKVVNLEKSNLDKRDYEFQAKSKEEPIMAPVTPVMESKFYGTSKLSYQDLGEARLVIKHSQPVNTDIAAGRTMHIESIYVENADGERFKYPYKHLNGARALAEHLKHGGNPYDSIGKYITGLSEEMASLRKFKGYVSRNEALAEAMGDIPSKVFERIDQIKEQVQKLQRKAYYEQFAEAFQESEEQMIPEEMMNDWVDRLTIRTFNEDLKEAFPYIFKLVSESDIPVKELGPEDMLSELSKDTLNSYINKSTHDGDDDREGERTVNRGRESGVTKAAYRTQGLAHKKGSEGFRKYKTDDALGEDEDAIKAFLSAGGKIQHGKLHKPRKAEKWQGSSHIGSGKAGKNANMSGKGANTNPKGGKPVVSVEDQFEAFINSITENVDEQLGSNTLTSPNNAVQQAAIDKLNQIIASELPGGPSGINAIESLKGIIDDPEFLSMLKDIDPALDTRPLIQQYVLHAAPEVAHQLNFGEIDSLGGEEPAPMPAAAPAPAPAPAPEAVPPEAAAAAPAPEAVPPAPAPVAESTSKLKAKLIKAKECGAGLDTELDFGHRKMTLGDAIRECGMAPEDIGFESEVISGHEKMIEMVKSFWNDEENNFPIGGTRVKQKIVKAFKDGEFPDVGVDDVKEVLVKIEELDPSSGEKNTLVRLAGLPEPEMSVHEGPGDPQQFDLDNILAQLKSMQDNPDQLGQQVQKRVGAELQKVQGQVPDQNVQFPGGQMNPQEMMKALMQKINFGN